MIMRTQLIFCIALLCLNSTQCFQFEPFTKGNLLVLKKFRQPFSANRDCVAGAIAEVTVDGQIVQEVLLPTNATEGPACLLFPGNFKSRSTISVDGYLAIIPCCNLDPDPAVTTLQISFAFVHGNGKFEVTDISNFKVFNDGTYPVNAVNDGTRIYFSLLGDSVWSAVGSSPILIYQQASVNALLIHNGSLYASDWETLPCAIIKLGDGLPINGQTSQSDCLLPAQTADCFMFMDNLLIVSYYPTGLNVYNASSLDLLSSSDTGGEVVQFVPLFDQNKAIGHVFDDPPSIYTYTWNNSTRMVTDKQIFLTYDATAFYYSPTLVPINSCKDGLKNFDETDVDCGGSSCTARCELGQSCASDEDCVNNTCIGGTCSTVPVAPVAQPMAPAAAEPISALPQAPPVVVPNAKTSVGSQIIMASVEVVVSLSLLSL